MTKLFARFAKDEAGATAIEYGLIAALIAVVIIGALQMLGGNISTAFESIADAVGGAGGGGGGGGL
jgi:pilus assembly protein Flp/PilA